MEATRLSEAVNSRFGEILSQVSEVNAFVTKVSTATDEQHTGSLK